MALHWPFAGNPPGNPMKTILAHPPFNAMPIATPTTAVPAPLGLGLLVALVVGSIVGSGIFGLPQNMAAGAGAGAILIGWTITGVGMLTLARVFQVLARRRPDLDKGVYAYARALSGDYVGFNSAWGYWVSAWLGNVGYLVAAFGALGYFFPAFGEGNTPAVVLGASVVLWTVHALVLRGIQGRGGAQRHGHPGEDRAAAVVHRAGGDGFSDRNLQA